MGLFRSKNERTVRALCVDHHFTKAQTHSAIGYVQAGHTPEEAIAQVYNDTRAVAQRIVINNDTHWAMHGIHNHTT